MCQFIEILDPNDLKDDDITIIQKPNSHRPGLAELNQATIGQAKPETPNSQQLKSWTGEPIGFVAHAHMIEAPFDNVYWLES